MFLAVMLHTLCSSCLTSSTAPSLNVQRTMSVSGEVPFTHSLLDSLDQKSANLSSLMRCQTWLNLASMMADSVTEVDVGMRFEEAMVRDLFPLDNV